MQEAKRAKARIVIPFEDKAIVQGSAISPSRDHFCTFLELQVILMTYIDNELIEVKWLAQYIPLSEIVV